MKMKKGLHVVQGNSGTVMGRSRSKKKTFDFWKY